MIIKEFVEKYKNPEYVHGGKEAQISFHPSFLSKIVKTNSLTIFSTISHGFLLFLDDGCLSLWSHHSVISSYATEFDYSVPNKKELEEYNDILMLQQQQQNNLIFEAQQKKIEIQTGVERLRFLIKADENLERLLQ